MTLFWGISPRVADAGFGLGGGVTNTKKKNAGSKYAVVLARIPAGTFVYR